MAVFLPENLYGIIGWPLAQTLSPLLHNTGLQDLHLPGVYMKWPLPPEDLKDFVTAMRVLDIRGCSVTIPHKVKILDLLDEISPTAVACGAVNTVFWKKGNLTGENTDVAGFLAPLKDRDLENWPTLILGAGGAARAVASALAMRNCVNITITSPGNKSQYALAEKFGLNPILWENRFDMDAKLVINTTPIGMKGRMESESPYDFSSGHTPGVAYDLVYNPLRTVFLQQAKEAGWSVISGMEMFYWQADAQFMLWTGQSLPESAKEALKKALGAGA